jgi:DNA-binding response OmpR family regulator
VVPSDTEARLPQRERRVLVVEDDRVIASSLTADLKEFGFVVIGPAHNLADASAMASTSALDCALIDIALGVETALPVAQILADRQIPFVFMTGQSEGMFHEVPTLLKPFTFKELRLALQQLLPPDDGEAQE